MAEDKEVTIVEKKSFGGRLGSALFGAAKVGAVGALAGTATAAVAETLAPGVGEAVKESSDKWGDLNNIWEDPKVAQEATNAVAESTTGEKLMEGAKTGAAIGGLVGAGAGLGEKYAQPEESWARKVEIQRNQRQNTGHSV